MVKQFLTWAWSWSWFWKKLCEHGARRLR